MPHKRLCPVLASDKVRPVDIVALSQIVTSVTNTLFVIVLAAGYYFTWRVSQNTLREMRAQRTAMGRPLVIVQEDYESLPELDVAIRNVSEGHCRRTVRSPATGTSSTLC